MGPASDRHVRGREQGDQRPPFAGVRRAGFATERRACKRHPVVRREACGGECGQHVRALKGAFMFCSWGAVIGSVHTSQIIRIMIYLIYLIYMLYR